MIKCNHAPWQVSTLLDEILRDAYMKPARAYHCFSHVEEVLAHFDDVAAAGMWREPSSVFAATLFHDAIYVAGRSDNEQKSADLAVAFLRAQPIGHPLDFPRIEQLILLTAKHGRIQPGEVDEDAALFLDCDTAILASSAQRFAQYDEEIAAEFSAIPPQAFATGRRLFLTNMLKRSRIFLSDHFHRRYDAQARANLAWAVEKYTAR
jgi:predicted metal-dependent HD superfamily phosphohydrolase